MACMGLFLTENKAQVNKSILEEVKDYSGLKMLLSRKLNRAL